MIKVYAPVLRLDVFTDWLGQSSEFERCEDIDQVLDQYLKIACLTFRFDEELSIDYKKFDLLLISDIEFNHIRPVNEWIEKLGIKNYLFALGGVENYSAPKDMIYRPWWTFNLMTQNTPQHTRVNNPKFDFEILFGAKKPHRDFVMAKCQKSSLLDTSIVNYRTVFPGPVLTDETLENYTKTILNGEELKYPYLSPNLNNEWEVAPEINYWVSHWVPWGIYNQTKYSTILETVYERVFFFSEKPAKVLYGKRIFIVFSCQHYLKQMRELLGFKTFDGIIDESYDNEPNTIKRFEMAFEQMEWLARQDYQDIKLRTDAIVEYNYNRLFSLRQEVAEQMQQMVYNKIKEITC